jgi:hypothetical protein
VIICSLTSFSCKGFNARNADVFQEWDFGLSTRQVWIWRPSEILRRVVWYKLTIALMMEAVSASETSVNFYETTRPSIAQGCHLHLHGGVYSIMNTADCIILVKSVCLIILSRLHSDVWAGRGKGGGSFLREVFYLLGYYPLWWAKSSHAVSLEFPSAVTSTRCFYCTCQHTISSSSVQALG